MERVTVYLRTSLFSIGGNDAHLPAGVQVIEGHVTEQGGSGVQLETHRLLDEKGRELSDVGLTLHVPWSKVDHIVLSGD